jgi:hypothetical protein
VSVDLCNHGKPLVAGFCLRCQAEANAARRRSPAVAPPAPVVSREAKPGDVWPEIGKRLEDAERLVEIAKGNARAIAAALGWAGEWSRNLPPPTRDVVALIEDRDKLRTSRDQALAVLQMAIDALGNGDGRSLVLACSPEFTKRQRDALAAAALIGVKPR